MIGGLSQESDLKHRTKLPLAGDLPVLSALFNAENSTGSKTDLYIVVTPHVVRGGEPLPVAVRKESSVP